jgi:hypothetical protein
MLTRRFLPWLGAILLVLAFAYGLLHLFSLRFAQGDVYPPYSSLRSDPLGTKALYDALNDVQSVQTARNFRALQQLKPEHPITLLYLGVAQEAKWGRSELRHFETLVGSGSRGVFAFAPRQPVTPPKPKKEAEADKDAKAKADKEEKEKNSKKDGTDEKKDEDSEDEEADVPGLLSFDVVAARWGVGIGRVASAKPSKKKPADDIHDEKVIAKLADSKAALEPELPYRSAIYFKDLQPAWRVLYRVGEHPVLIERPWGDGTIVLTGDPYFLSNEALRNEPHPKLLAWLAGTAATIVFDEEHHGIREEMGIAALAQKYRLQGAIIALLVVVALAIWRSSVPFVRLAQDDDEERVEGRDAAEAFSSLLRRSVSPARILDVCLQEWRKSFARSPRDVAAVEAVLAEEEARPPRDRGPVRTYRRISEALRTQSHSPTAK